MRILLIEDDEILGNGVQTGLTQNGLTVDWLKDGASGERAILNDPTAFDIIVLDLGLPKLEGLQLLRNIRANCINTPVLILTARETTEDRIKGLDSGADDYLTKPFDLDELSARLRALQRRALQINADPKLVYKDIVMEPASHSVQVCDHVVNLSRREFALLQKLIERPGHVFSRESLTQSLYGWVDDIESNTLEVYIHNIRKKLLHSGKCILTIRGVGYMVEKENLSESNEDETSSDDQISEEDL